MTKPLLTPTRVQYVVGDATDQSVADGSKIIAHVCNDAGRWGKGFVLAISQHWPEPEYRYREAWANRDGDTLPLGRVQFVQVDGARTGELWVANMIAQHGVRGPRNRVPLRYNAVEACLQEVAKQAQFIGASVHMPRIGTGLAGGTWDLIEPRIRSTLCALAVPVTVYDLPQSAQRQTGRGRREG